MRIPWSTEKYDRFARDWQDGLESTALREKYGISSPTRVADQLRRRGYVMTSRQPGRGRRTKA